MKFCQKPGLRTSLNASDENPVSFEYNQAMLPLKNLMLLLRQAVDRWNADRAPRLSAALAYYATFSLAPLALVTIWIAGSIFGERDRAALPDRSHRAELWGRQRRFRARA